MAQLSKILGSILRDMVTAQHEANMYALKLSSSYRNQHQATTLRPPTVCLGEIELMLHCSFSGKTVSGENYEIDHTAVVRTIQMISSEMSEVVVSCILSTVIQHSNDYEKGEGPIARMNREKTLRRDFIAFLSRKLYEHLKSHRTEFIVTDGSIDVDILKEKILYIAENKFLLHSDLQDIFRNDNKGELRKQINENLQANIQIMLPRVLQDVQIARPSKYDSMDVIISSDELSKLPDECIQTLRLKIQPRDLPSENDAE